MKSYNVTKASTELYKLLDYTTSKGEPIQIIGKRNNAVLVSEEEWRTVQETLYLLSIPKMRDSIIEGLKTPIEECSEEPGW